MIKIIHLIFNNKKLKIKMFVIEVSAGQNSSDNEFQSCISPRISNTNCRLKKIADGCGSSDTINYHYLFMQLYFLITHCRHNFNCEGYTYNRSHARTGCNRNLCRCMNE